MNIAKKAHKAQSRADIDIKESRGYPNMRRYAKREYNRAMRRLGKAVAAGY